jgi:O-succinylbenzoate synthase
LSSKLPAEVKYALRDSDPQLATKPFEDMARLCYLWDRQMVEWADIVVAEASFPSIGLGIEMQIAEARGTPIIMVFRKAENHRAAPVLYQNPDNTRHSLQLGEGYVSLMALGVPSVLKVMAYSSSSEGYSQILAALREVQKPLA